MYSGEVSIIDVALKIFCSSSPKQGDQISQDSKESSPQPRVRLASMESISLNDEGGP